jgi:hypothetical protein
MGNGQCPECYALGPSWLGLGGRGLSIGHKPECGMAAALEAVGQKVVFDMPYDRNDDAPGWGISVGSVNWDSPKTQALCAAIENAHPGYLKAKP